MNQYKRRAERLAVTAAALLLSAVLAGACKDDTISNLNDIVFPEKNISYNRTVQPLFNIACATSSCHDTKTYAANLDLTSYSGVLQRKYDVFIAHDTTLSKLIWVIEAKNGALPMPPTRALTLNQRRGLKQWIIEGATDTIK